MNREEALRQLQATTEFVFVGDKVLVRQAALLRAVAELQPQPYVPVPTERHGMPTQQPSPRGA